MDFHTRFHIHTNNTAIWDKKAREPDKVGGRIVEAHNKG